MIHYIVLFCIFIPTKTIKTGRANRDKIPGKNKMKTSKKEESVKVLKKRIGKLPYLFISMRDDQSSIEDLSYAEKLTFRIWEKTEGENWGNSMGTEFVFRIGNKYVRMDMACWSTGNHDFDSWSYIPISGLSEIVDLLEEAAIEEDNIDRDKLLLKACSRVQNLEPNRY